MDSLPKGHLTDHYDLLIETDGHQLLSWRLFEFPGFGESQLRELAGVQSMAAQRIPNHRPLYLDYEGPLSDHRGRVTRLIDGRYLIYSLESNAVALDEMSPVELLQQLDGTMPALKPDCPLNAADRTLAEPPGGGLTPISLTHLARASTAGNSSCVVAEFSLSGSHFRMALPVKEIGEEVVLHWLRARLE